MPMHSPPGSATRQPSGSLARMDWKMGRLALQPSRSICARAKSVSASDMGRMGSAVGRFIFSFGHFPTAPQIFRAFLVASIAGFVVFVDAISSIFSMASSCFSLDRA